MLTQFAPTQTLFGHSNGKNEALYLTKVINAEKRHGSGERRRCYFSDTDNKK
jgi:hypothetical protein